MTPTVVQSEGALYGFSAEQLLILVGATADAEKLTGDLNERELFLVRRYRDNILRALQLRGVLSLTEVCSAPIASSTCGRPRGHGGPHMPCSAEA